MKYIINIDLANPIYENDREVDYVDNDTGMKWTISKTGLKKMKPLEEQIIQCKDCKYWKHDHTCREHSLVSPMLANEFCSRAERREE